ncbi:hypothetical protein PHYBLDRAFT_187307 [Phycomyces blakesleeanus NRRL 1555(-)]|uniref:Uncharacterized protein n=1 Tax=Phycomyces blakesleeanus (strain ATCC 8743b / DSM 1359 / FGSC 10004 / NBRC 33097 / NRRL 1555) TaxID=763407 RepID=A0A163AFD2_PHYB8|nr:hypothetical protein PHYBLDRAFT_187307 [Phycomyces blakesleeanus NRRL 1555(-)]OAD73111.1 hypothetical protein PHYBLDRAFT_187307 [Phycomyces blakesleeanus NRRL 1555(-)]|eukprot:XP_018291151.1 hypothetical protein PHYBLDRAFT_187307 [Phycomyces blakesleeanus NRRL 1555(-)]
MYFGVLSLPTLNSCFNNDYRVFPYCETIKRFAWLKQGGSTTLKLFQYFLVTYEKDTDSYVTVDVSKIMSGFDLMTKPSSSTPSVSNVMSYTYQGIINPTVPPRSTFRSIYLCQ